jgi:hypothetical protein
MKNFFKKIGLLKVALQIFKTTKICISGCLSGKPRESFFWFMVRNKVSLFGMNIHNANLGSEVESLRKNSYQELKQIDNNLTSEIVKLFLKRCEFSSNNNSLSDYFAAARASGYCRSKTVGIENERDLIDCIFQQTNMKNLALQYLELRESEAMFSAKIDSLVRLSGERKYRNDHYDDALSFHRDVDSLRFVKGFIYLNEISEGCGHHEVYLGSNVNLPISLLPIARYSGHEIKSKIPHLYLKKVVGKAGFAWLEDTTAFHRGTYPINGDRLILSFSFNDKFSAKENPYNKYYNFS